MKSSALKKSEGSQPVSISKVRAWSGSVLRPSRELEGTFVVSGHADSLDQVADLLKAAPDMLEMLIKLNDMIEGGNSEVELVIAQARGENIPVKTEYSTLTGLWFVYNSSGVIIKKFPLECQARDYIATGGR